MTPQLTVEHMNALRRAQGVWGIADPGVRCDFVPVGTGACWIDQGFGMSAVVYDVTRLVRERVTSRLNEYLVHEEGRRAAEHEPLENLLPQAPNDNIREYKSRAISKAKARTKILAYLRKKPGADGFEVAVALKLDPTFALDVCDQLFREGKIEVARDAAVG